MLKIISMSIVILRLIFIILPTLHISTKSKSQSGFEVAYHTNFQNLLNLSFCYVLSNPSLFPRHAVNMIPRTVLLCYINLCKENSSSTSQYYHFLNLFNMFVLGDSKLFKIMLKQNSFCTVLWLCKVLHLSYHRPPHPCVSHIWPLSGSR